MNIAIVGGGPAGLYFALLMARAEHRHEITVYERNAPDATFGWGVVFSEDTLGELRDADYPTYVAITESFARWDAIDIHYGGRTLRSRGHAFSAISRKLLLAILQRRCADLGVTLRFRTEQADAAIPGADIVVAADGVNSTLRPPVQDRLQPSVDVHASRYAWFGTDLVFDAFTFIFRETEHGLFQVHAYPYDATASTFIVETTERAWRAAGLDTATEQESIAFCEALFAPELRGHKLLSNRSTWNTFLTIRHATWHAGRLVFMGDAVHTAHFSIGSGTKLAMEDAIALAAAFQRHTDIEAAFTEYELERQPVVERFQEAARVSSRYFESVRRYAEFPDELFAFNLLTRSGRITHLNLEMRDPAFVARVDGRFATEAGAAAALVPVPPAHVPLRLGATVLPNRVALAAVAVEDAVDGALGPAGAASLRTGAAAMPGVVVTEFVAVSAHGRVSPGTPGLYEPEHEGAWATAIARAREHGATRFALRLGHAGARGAVRPRWSGTDRPLREGAWPLVAASPHRYTARAELAHELDDGRMTDVAEDFALVAARAAAAGFDILELDMGHGYLLGSFLSPLTNRRTDAYGGAVEARLRYPLRVVEAVLAEWPTDRPLFARIAVTDWTKGGTSPEDAVVIARSLTEAGVALIHVVAGGTVAEARPEYGRVYLGPLADQVRNEARVPVLVGGNITTRDQVNTLLAAGRADLCLLDT